MSKAYNDLYNILVKKETSEFMPSPLFADFKATTLPVKTPSLETEKHSTIPTFPVGSIETEHGRMRRKQRAITSKRDLPGAKKEYGGKFITTSD